MPSHDPNPLRLDGVSFAYPARPDVPVLTDVSLTVAPGQRVGLIGENGGGKSTLLRLAAGSLAPGRGTVARPASCGVLLQEHDDGGAATLGSVVERAVAGVTSGAIGLNQSVTWKARHFGLPVTMTDLDMALAETFDEVFSALLEGANPQPEAAERRAQSVVLSAAEDLGPERPAGASGAWPERQK